MFHPEDNFRFAPDDVTGGTPAAPAATASAGTETPAANVPAQAASTSTPAAPAASPSAGTTVTQPAAATPSWLDSFRKEGFNATDENAAREQLLQAHRDAERLRPLAPHLSAYQQHATEFQQFLAEKQKKTAQPAEADWTQKLGWNPPPYDANLRHQVTTDAQGNLIAVPGAPPDVVPRYQAAQAFRQEQVEKFLTNPFKYMEPAIRHIAGEIAASQAQQGVGQYREQQEAQTFVQQHSNWLFEQNEGKVKTQAVINPQTGRYESQQVLSKWGQHFLGSLNEAAKAGLTPEMQQKFALQSVQNAYMASNEYQDYIVDQRKTVAPAAAAAPAVTPREAANATFTQRANPAQQPSPSANGGNAVPAPQTVNRNNLADVMRRRFEEAGVTP